jgi:hypothetical protein
MRKITDLYKEYKIIPNLETHQLRVAACAMQICKHLTVEIDTESVIKACLLHDMANIIKFDLSKTQAMFNFSNEEIEIMAGIKAEFIKKYGTSEHIGSLTIARELGMDEKVVSNIDAIDFNHWDEVDQGESIEEKICVYCDGRVAPYGVVSLSERLEEGSKRYAGPNPQVGERRIVLHNAARSIEKDIFSHCSIMPQDITEASVAPYIELLKEYEI